MTEKETKEKPDRKLAGPGESTLIRLVGVSKHFVTGETETKALSDINLDISSGEYVAIAGPPGCGKSTLLSILGLLEPVTSGTYLLRGERVDRDSLSQLEQLRDKTIGFVLPFDLIPDLNVYENVELPLTYRRMSARERKEQVQFALETVGMSHRMKHYPGQLSAGQQQRVAIARSIVGKPSILLADEPIGGLNGTDGAAIMELFRKLHAEGMSLCVATQDMQRAAHADRQIYMADGRVVANRTWNTSSIQSNQRDRKGP
jgi:putative ABC transport system ATP-binding protein